MKHHRRPTSLGRPDLAPERLEQRRLLAAVDAIDFNIPEFTADNVASFDLYEDAAVVDGELRVAPDVRYGQGAFFTKDNLTLTPDKGFATSFSFDMGGVRGTSGGAGMAFVLFGRDTDPSLPAFPGGGLGYSGLWPSLAIEFDSAQSAGDPSGDHVAIHTNGNATSPLAANTVVAVGGQLNDGQTRYAWVDYSGDTDVLRVYLNDVAQKPDQPTLSTTLDLSSLVGSAPRFGFTAASGYNFNHHDVSSWSFETVLPTTQPNQPPVAVDDNVLIEQNSGVNSIAVLPNDSDPDDDVLTITSAGPATNGTVTTNGQLVFYTPNLGYAGPDSFSYVVSDGRGGLSTATVDVTVQQIAAAGTFQLGSGTFEAVEGEGFVDVTVLRNGDTSTVATLDYLTSDGTATAGVDYQSRAGTLRFDPGQTSQTIRINISDDQLNEGDETFAISLDAVTGANLGAPRTAQITILDDDQPDGNGGLPWLEDFNLPNGTSTDTGTTAWSIDLNGSPASALQVNGNRLRLSDTDGPVEWRTDPIALGDADSASLSLRLSAAGSMETTGQFLDYVDVFYAADGDSPQLLERIVGNIGQRTLTYDGLVGNTVELIIRGVTTAGSEVYFIDDVLLEAAETPTFIPFSYYAQTEVPAETLGGDWQVVTGGSAGNHAVWNGGNFYNNPPAGDALAFDIVAETAGLYDVHLRAKAPSGDDDSVWVRISGTDVAQSNNISRTDGWVKFNNIARSSSFVWDRVHNVDAGSEPVSFFLPAGTHTLEIAAREDGTGIDGVYVTNTLDAPSTAQLDLSDGIDEPVEPVGDFRRTEIVSDGLQNVTDVKWAGSLGDVLFVSERAGRIRIVEDGSLVNQAFVAFEDEVNGTRDRGLLGIELHPDFPTVPYVYALFTYDPPEAANGTGLAARDANGNRAGRVVRYTADAATNFRTAVPGSQLVVLGKNSTWDNISSPDKDSTGRNNFDIPASGTPEDPDNNGEYINDFIASDSQSHSVGDLAFDSDGNLLVTLGDATSYGAVDPRSKYVQDINTLRGKVLRVDPETGLGVSDNPFWTGDGNDNASRVWALGLRNPFSVAVQPDDGDLFIGDVGWYTSEEVNRVDMNGTGGDNHGWPWYEGQYTGLNQTPGYLTTQDAQDVYNGDVVLDGDLVLPTFSRDHSDGSRAFIIGDFLVGNSWPSALRGSLLLVDWQSGRVEAVVMDANDQFVRTETLLTSAGPITSMSRTDDGRLYYGTWNGDVGIIDFA